MPSREYEVEVYITYLDDREVDEQGFPQQDPVFIHRGSFQKDDGGIQLRSLMEYLRKVGTDADVAVAEYECEQDGHLEFEEGYCVNCGKMQEQHEADPSDDYKSAREDF